MKHGNIDDLFPFRVLAAVNEFGTVTEAALELSLSPSAVSQQLQRLGRTLGTPMTIRTGRRVALTPAAHELLAQVSPLLDQFDQVTRQMSTPSTRLTGRVRVAAFTSAIRGGLLTAVAELRDQHPGLSINIVELEADKSEAALASGRIDLALVPHWRGQPRPPHPKLTSRRLLDDPADIICLREDTGITASTPPEILVERPWVSAPGGTLGHLLADAGKPPRVAAELSDLALHIEFVRAGLGLALAPRLGRPALPEGVIAVSLEDPPTRVVSIVTRTAQDEDAILLAVARQIRQRLTGTTVDLP
ncbi:LysR family transcriptional regulator [Kribbella sp. NPDC056861]|uniref:LysR family transcriptional regulator n=1 Tax=Kribbella sp. NPDC056861 TaxID=3154857 RepID=UPI003433B60F